MKLPYCIFISLLLLSSCKETDKQRITRLIKDWEGKEIIFPENIPYTIYGRDTVDYSPPLSSYTIVSYIDSVGCTSCRMQLGRWKEYMAQLDSVSQEEVVFKFIFHPKDKKELVSILNRDSFAHPVWIDSMGIFNTLNVFPVEHIFHTFLLDRQNKMIAMGNPVYNLKISELYQNIITGKQNNQNNTLYTEISVEKSTIDFGEFDWRETQMAVFTVNNTGKNLLVINDIISSCGCIRVKYPQEPVGPGDIVNIEVIYKADNPEYIDKSLKVYSNINSSPFELKFKGISK